jgi:hypothetical protein
LNARKKQSATLINGHRATINDFLDCQIRTIVSRGLPLTYFDDPEVQRSYFCLTDKDDISFSNATTIRTHLINVKLPEVKNTITRRLHDKHARSSKVALQVDGWSQKNSRSGFFAMIGHWITADMKWQEALLSFKPTEAAHAGDKLAAFVLDVLQDFDVIERTIAITADNAGNNRTMVENLNAGLDASGGSHLTRLPCLSHVVQLAQGALLKKLKCKPTNEQINRNFDSNAVLSERMRYNLQSVGHTAKKTAGEQSKPKVMPKGRPKSKSAPQQRVKASVRAPTSARTQGRRSATSQFKILPNAPGFKNREVKRPMAKGKGRMDEDESSSDAESELPTDSGDGDVTEISITLWKVCHEDNVVLKVVVNC